MSYNAAPNPSAATILKLLEKVSRHVGFGRMDLSAPVWGFFHRALFGRCMPVASIIVHVATRCHYACVGRAHTLTTACGNWSNTLDDLVALRLVQVSHYDKDERYMAVLGE